MATVLVSRQLIEDVKEGIREFAAKIKCDTINPLAPSVAEQKVVGGPMYEMCLSKVWGQFYDLYERLKVSRFAKTVDHFSLYVKADDSNATLLSLTVSPEVGKVQIPSFTSGYYDVDVTIKQSELVGLPWAAEFIEAKTKYDAALKAHNEKFNTLADQVTGFIRSSKSLNDALKKYPDLRLWIPKQYQEKLDEVVERKPRAQRVKEEAEQAVSVLDVNLITSMGVMKTLQAA